MMLRRDLSTLTLGAVLLTAVALERLPAATTLISARHLAANTVITQLPPGTLVVTNTADSGPGSLRAAIDAANTSPGPTRILFRIPTSDPGFAGGVFTIRPTSALPPLQSPSVVDGFSQIAFSGDTNAAGPEVVLNGAAAGAGADGLVVESSNTEVRALVIQGFSGVGLRLGGDSNRIGGCFIGTNAAGTGAVPNSAEGILFGGNHHQIGGTEPRLRNVISGNRGAGIFSSGTTGSALVNNYIGTNALGSAPVPNGASGIWLLQAFDVRIGSTESGSRNVISGNTLSGITLEDGNRNSVQGNHIGTDAAGLVPLPNRDGVNVSEMGGVLIGGPLSAARNVISGNRQDGVVFTRGTSSSGIQGNYIGLNAAGTAAVPNGESGVKLEDSAGNVVGGTTPAARNIISGNRGDGVSLRFDAERNLIQGNYIGTNLVGRTVIPNGGSGVLITDDARSNEVGGATAGARNVISGNVLDGVRISGEILTDPAAAPSSDNHVEGNLIGTDYSGDRALPNGANGVHVEGAPRNFVGGSAAGVGNVISGNLGSGVLFAGSLTRENEISGNFIGTRAGGTVALPNAVGVTLAGNAESNLVGGTSSAARNVISGNTEAGVRFDAAGPANRVQGNYIGTNVHGSGAVPNGAGVSVFFSAGVAFNDIGGDVPGAGNVISGNFGPGVVLEDTNRYRIRGNVIGTNALGTAGLGNGSDGVGIGNAGGCQIGGPGPYEGNLISGNRGNGIGLDRGTGDVLIEGNRVGLNLAGTAAVPNLGYGVQLFEVGPNTVGGTAAGSRNIISGNGKGGIRIAEGAEDNDVMGNYIGTDARGSVALPNAGPGVLIEQSAGNHIGAAAAGAGNLISGNQSDGILITAFGIDVFPGNDILGNRIGTTASGVGPLPNRGHGVELRGEAQQGNRIGGVAPGEGNRIAFNLGDGVLLTASGEDDPTLIGNPVRGNSIEANGGLGINLRPPGEPPGTVTPNDAGDIDFGINQLQNFPILIEARVQAPVLTTVRGTLNSFPDRSFVLDFYRSPTPDPSGFGEGRDHLGSLNVATNASGSVSFAFVVPAGEPGYFTATATDEFNNTSEFGPWVAGVVIGVPPGVRSALAAPTIEGRVADASGAALPGVRVMLLEPGAPRERWSPDWDPARLAVTHTDADGNYRFAGLPRRSYEVLAYRAGSAFTSQVVDLTTQACARLVFIARADERRPAVTATVNSPVSASGAAVDSGGAGVRMVLVRLKVIEADGERWLNWPTGIWSRHHAPTQYRQVTQGPGGEWHTALPGLLPGKFELEVQAFDWAGQASSRETVPFVVR